MHTNWPMAQALLSLILLPLLPALVDLFPAFRAARVQRSLSIDSCTTISDFTVLVPIYGSLEYLENVEYLAQYGDRVTLCTTDSESDEFNSGIVAISAKYGFSVHFAPVYGHVTPSRKQVAGTTRDLIIRDATMRVTSSYVVCIDADTTTSEPLDQLVGALVANRLDLASVRLVPSNRDRLLGRLQAHEYRMSMKLRGFMPFLCSGALQICEARAHREIMARHSLFFQGNDVETGLLGDALGFKVGYLPFEVPTTVPDQVKTWWRQRVAWSGGEFRLFIINFGLVVRHPFFVLYGSLVVIALWPVRTILFLHPGYSLLSTVVIYSIAISVINRRTLDWSLAIYPLYGMFISIVVVPLGAFSYLRMALSDNNFGVIRSGVAFRRPSNTLESRVASDHI